ncbi:hypothetical protein [Crateriforma conspicua]|uniref:hypothetical protein n=1 Tax=Crateriforma conspicua TaxID=2527996 RepID=UPI0011A3FD05|nr:hypothetical protein [Crateriforma conspicua]
MPFFLLLSVAEAYPQEGDRSRLLHELTERNTRIDDGFQVEYDVELRLLEEPRPAKTVHIGGFRIESLISGWSGVHAWENNRAKFYHSTTVESLSDRPELPTSVLSDGKNFYMIRHETEIARVTRNWEAGRYPKEQSPEEELYLELLGRRSDREGWGVTMRADERPGYADVVRCLADESYASSTTQRGNKHLFLLEYPGVDRLVLDPEMGGAIVEREFYWQRPGREGISTSYECSDFESVNGVWLPRAASIRYWSRESPSRAIVQADLTVKKIGLVPNPSLFEVPVDQIRGFLDADRMTTVRAEPLNGRTIREFLDSAPIADSVRPGVRMPVIVLMVGIMFVVSGVLIWKRQRSREV